MKIFILSIVTFFSFSLCSQDIYEPLKSQGEIPEEFISSSSEKYEEAIGDLDRSNSRVYSDKKEFLLKSNYSIDDMLRGGQILFNDPISVYVNKVADEIYSKNPDIPEGLRFYVSRSSATNAFSTNQGIIFITTGLISQLENEAQLAFIISHEISHYVKKHTIESFLESKSTIRNNRNVRSLDDYIALMSKYSKSQELEADSEGLEYYLNLDYEAEEAVTAFNVLHYSYLPFNEIPFELDYLVNEDFKIKAYHKLDSINEIDVFNEDYDDSESSHPNIWKRKQEMISNLKNRKSKGNEWFVVGEQDFVECQELARRESVRIHLMQGDYHEAIYESFLISLKDSTDVFAKVSTAKALYGLQQHDAFHEIREVLPKTKYIEGESSRLVHFLNELTNEQLSIVAVQNLHEVTTMFPENEYYADLLEDCLWDMVYENEMHFDDFLSERKIEIVHEVDSLLEEVVEVSTELEPEVKERERSGKYGKIEEIKEEVENNEEEKGEEEKITVSSDDDHYVYSLIVPLQDSAFSALFEGISLQFDADEEENDALTSREKWSNKRKETKAQDKFEKRILREGTSLGLESAVFYDPSVNHYRYNKGLDYLDSEDGNIVFTEKLQEYALESGKDYNVIGFNTAEEVDTEMYNHMSRLSAFTYEAHRLESIEVDMIPSEAEYSDELIGNLGSEYLVMTSVTAYLEKREIEPTVWFYSVLMFPVLPATIGYAATRVKHNIHGLKVINLKDGSLIHRSYRDLKVKKSDRILGGVAYDTINQISRSRD